MTGLSTLRRRSSVDALDAGALAALRAAWTGMLALEDERGFLHWAGLHGLPLPSYCQHGTPLFLPWHRAYLYFFEQFLLDQGTDATLPWWDWSARTGVPASYVGETLPDGAANPLASGPVSRIPDGQFARAGLPPVDRTYRQPDDPVVLPGPDQVSDVLGAADFTDFTARVEDLHNGVHLWVGGTMGVIPVAAYDPLFWAHHAMVDRLWYLWQLGHPGGTPDAAILDTALAPFSMTVRETLDIATLGYDYSATVATGTPAAAAPDEESGS